MNLARHKNHLRRPQSPFASRLPEWKQADRRREACGSCDAYDHALLMVWGDESPAAAVPHRTPRSCCADTSA